MVLSINRTAELRCNSCLQVVQFQVTFNDEPHTCEISYEALEDLDGSVSNSDKDLFNMFWKHVETIEQVAQQKIPTLIEQGEQALLRTQDFYGY